MTGLRIEIWGTPWALSHDFQRGNCLNEDEPVFGNAKCRVAKDDPPHSTQAYLTLPASCESPLTYTLSATSWQDPTTSVTTTSTSPPLQKCNELVFNPVPKGTLSTNRASSPTGYEFTLDGNSQAVLVPSSRATSQPKKAVVRLPEGMSVNPSVASGLGTCSEAQFAAETITSQPGAGCPNDSKVGELVIESPLVEDQIEGSMFFATPREPLRDAAGAVPDREVSGARHPRQGRRQGRLRPRDRPADDHVRRPAPASLLALQRPLPRRPAQPARHPLGMRQFPDGSRDRSLARPDDGPPPVLAVLPDGGGGRRPLPAGAGAVQAGRRRRHAQRQRDLVLAVLPAPDADRRRAGDHLLLLEPAEGPARQNRRRPLLPREPDRGRQSTRPVPNPRRPRPVRPRA